MTLKETGDAFRAQVHRIVVGQEETVTLSFLALCLGGHVLHADLVEALAAE